MVSKRNDHYMIIDKKKSFFFFLGNNIYKSKCSNKITKKKKIMKHISYHL